MSPVGRWFVGLAALALASAWAPSLAQQPAEPEVEERDEAWTTYDQAMDRGQKTAAADALLAILDDPEAAELHGQAWVELGELLDSFDMGYSALIAYSRAIAADPDAAAGSVGHAMDLAEALGDEPLLAPVLAANVGIEVDGATRSRMAYLAARHYFQQSEYGTATGILHMVKKGSRESADAKALRGVILAQQGRHEDALAPLLRALELGRDQGRDARFINVTHLNIARAFFGADNYARAIEYYAKVERGSEFWPQATFERAWCHFMVGDATGTIALMMNHDSPFFRDWYFPEGDLLRAHALFLMCKFPDAGEQIDAFIARYSPIREQLQAQVATMTPAEAWDDLRAHEAGRPTRLPPTLLRRYQTEDRIQGAMRTVDKADDELSRLANVSANPFAARAITWLGERRTQIVQTEGGRVLANAHLARSELAGMLSDVQVTKLDIMQYETRMYENASFTGELHFGDRLGRLRSMGTLRGHQAWPFEGEYWADELGYYRIDARPDCPADLIAGE